MLDLEFLVSNRVVAADAAGKNCDNIAVFWCSELQGETKLSHFFLHNSVKLFPAVAV